MSINCKAEQCYLFLQNLVALETYTGIYSTEWGYMNLEVATQVMR